MKSIKDFSIIIFLINTFIICGCGNRIPKDVNQLILENANFKKPITCPIPLDDRNWEKQLLEWERENGHKDLWSGGLPPAGSSSADKLLNGLNDDLLKFLKKHNFVTVKHLTINSALGKQDHDLLIYNERIKEYILDSNATDALTGVYKIGMSLLLGKRELKEVEITKEGKIDFNGVKIKFMELTIKYSLTTVINGAGPKSNEYLGKATFYFDPEKDIWILENLELGDKGIKEYIF